MIWWSFEDETNELGMNFATVNARVYFIPHHGCGPSWSEWSGGDPGFDPYIEIEGFQVESITPDGGDKVDFSCLDTDMKKKVLDWVDCKMDDKFANNLWEYVDDERH